MGSSATASELLSLRHPIVQGPFGGGLSTIELVSAVADRGGLGSFGAHVLSPDALIETAARLRSRTSGAFALNLWVSDHDAGGVDVSADAFADYAARFAPYFAELAIDMPDQPARFHERFEDQAEALLEARPPAFSFVFGIPSTSILEACRARDIRTIGAATSLKEALALEAAGVDMIVATGFEAGGHRPSFLDRAEDSLMSTAALTQIVARRVSVPVIAAGGIVDAAGIAAARQLGASAAQLGTAFLACAESGTTDAHRQVLFDPDRVSDTVLTRSYTGRLARGVRNRLIDELGAREIAPFPVQAWFVSQLKAACARQERDDLTSLYAGQSAPNLAHRTVADLMSALTSGTASSAPASAA